MSQSERIFWINDKLQNKQILTIDDVVQHFGVSVRQVKRDFKKIREENGAPLKYNKLTKSYEYEGGFEKMKFASQEMILAYVMLDALAKNQSYSAVVSHDLLNEMRQKVPVDYRQVCDRIMYQLPYSQEISPDLFFVVCGSIQQRKQLHITYRNSKNEESERNIEPERLVNYEGSWYILGWDHKNERLANFNIFRIGSASVTEDDYAVHGGYPKMKDGFTFRNYDEELARYVDGGFGIFKGSVTKLARIRFTGEAANIVRDQHWHSKQVTKEDGNAVILQFPFSNSTELMGKILGYGADAQPLEPAELVEEWKKKITELSNLL